MWASFPGRSGYCKNPTFAFGLFGAPILTLFYQLKK